MRLISLDVSEWRAYKHCEIDFPDGLIGVAGPNGAGKTTIAEAVGWALFGKLRAGAKVSELRRQGESGRPTAELVFALGDVVYTVRRVAGGDCTLWIGDPDSEPEATGATNVSRRIARELDLTWDIFKRTVFAEQKDVAALDPKATGPSRRAHVERLLGLTRFKRAADAAKAKVKEIENEIRGRLAELDDPEDLKAALTDAQNAAEEDSPRVKQLGKDLAAARKAYEAARKAVEDEHERVKQAAVLEEQRANAEAGAMTAADRAKELQKRISEREKQRTRLETIDPDARKAAAAEKELAKWDELADATEELDQAREELAATGHDPEAARQDEKQHEALRKEQEVLCTSVADLRREVEQLTVRVPALRREKAVGKSADRKADVTKTQQEERRLDKQIGALEDRLYENREHLAAVEEAGPNTPCPVCKKPYGEEYDEIVEQYREEIADAEARLAGLQSALVESRRALEEAEVQYEQAREAERQISATEGSDTPSHAERRLGKATEQLEKGEARLLELDELVPGLADRVKAAAKSGRAWEAASGVVKERQRRFGRAAKALGVNRYVQSQRESAHKRAERLSAIAAEADELRTAIAAAAGFDKEAATASKTADEQRRKACSHEGALKELGVESGELERLRKRCRDAEERRDELASALTDAKLDSQERSHEVKECRARLKAVEKAIAEAEKRRAELRQYQVVADLLERFRGHEAQRAWPQLQRGASALLAAATDGRYADIRLSSDYRLAIVDRGDEHGLGRFSGGEQDLANLCLRLAIAEWVARERGADIGLLVLDEVFGSQDEDRRRLLMNQLRALSARFRQVLIITHVPDIAEMCDARIEVSMDEELSSTAFLAA